MRLQWALIPVWCLANAPSDKVVCKNASVGGGHMKVVSLAVGAWSATPQSVGQSKSALVRAGWVERTFRASAGGDTGVTEGVIGRGITGGEEIPCSRFSEGYGRPMVLERPEVRIYAHS